MKCRWPHMSITLTSPCSLSRSSLGENTECFSPIKCQKYVKGQLVLVADMLTNLSEDPPPALPFYHASKQIPSRVDSGHQCLRGGHDLPIKVYLILNWVCAAGICMAGWGSVYGRPSRNPHMTTHPATMIPSSGFRPSMFQGWPSMLKASHSYPRYSMTCLMRRCSACSLPWRTRIRYLATGQFQMTLLFAISFMVQAFGHGFVRAGVQHLRLETLSRLAIPGKHSRANHVCHIVWGLQSFLQ